MEREMQLSLLFQLLCLTAAAAYQLRPDCQQMCGNFSIPYPFGIGQGCFRPGFEVICNTTFRSPKPFLMPSAMEVMHISLHWVRIKGRIARRCYNDRTSSSKEMDVNMALEGDSPLTFSAVHNKFMAIGCNAHAVIHSTGNGTRAIECIPSCYQGKTLNGSCGYGCCHKRVKEGLKKLHMTIKNYRYDGHTNPCNYAFLIEKDQQNLNVPYLALLLVRHNVRVPVVLDWAIGNEGCEEAQKNVTSFACGENSYCYNAVTVPGYRCNCNKGYQGNPYLLNGCTDIDECDDPHTNPCSGRCENTPGSYKCINSIWRLNRFSVALSIGVSLVLFFGPWLYWGVRKRRLIKLREKFFQQNGGFLLQKQISSLKGAAETTKIFTIEELKRATNNYAASRMIGHGGNGTVYKGILPNNRIVAIKKSQRVDKTQIEQFVNEILILSIINHRHVVKLLGCCLETEVPLLVYEFISNGTLYHHIHHEDHASLISWDNRLRIAIEAAGALSYLHSASSTPIIHRDVKSRNILLDNNFSAKVSDFGASRPISFDQTHVTTLVQGTFGYLDPEYFHTSRLNEKSDVYSFGVVLVELLTGEKPVTLIAPDEARNLAAHFITMMGENCLAQIVEEKVMDEGDHDQIMAVARLAKKCLSLTGVERPTMNEVARELEELRRFQSSEAKDQHRDGSLD